MKKLFFLLMLVAMAFYSFSQPTSNTAPAVKIDYLQKSKRQKTTAWCLMGGGLISTGIGTVIALTEVTKISFFPWGGEPDQKKLNGASVFLSIGLTAIIVSIPFFIASGKNKRKAMSLSFKNETSPQIYKSSFVYKPVPSLTLKINL